MKGVSFSLAVRTFKEGYTVSGDSSLMSIMNTFGIKTTGQSHRKSWQRISGAHWSNLKHRLLYAWRFASYANLMWIPLSSL